MIVQQLQANANICFLVCFGQSKFSTAAPAFVWLTLRYDTRSRLLIRPHEKQQVDVSEAINQRANMAAAAKPPPPLHAPAERSRRRTCTLSRCTRRFVRPTHVCAAHRLSLPLFLFGFSAMAPVCARGPLCSQDAQIWGRIKNFRF